MIELTKPQKVQNDTRNSPLIIKLTIFLLCTAAVCIYVITVGAERPVNSCILESLRATSTWDQMHRSAKRYDQKQGDKQS